MRKQENYDLTALIKEYYENFDSSHLSETIPQLETTICETHQDKTINLLKPQIVIDPRSGSYTILDSHLNTVGKRQSNPYFKFFTRHFKQKKFKKQLHKDYKNYVRYCKKNKIKQDKNFKKMHDKMSFYLWLCPDADYDILELLRKYITKINPNYKNYQTACAEYLHELARSSTAEPENMPFDINIAEEDMSGNGHKYIANCFGRCKEPVETFINMMSDSSEKEREEFYARNTIKDTQISKFSSTKKVKAPEAEDLER